MTAGAVIDWAALGQVVWVSFAGALALVLGFTGGVLLVEPASPGAPVGVLRRGAGVALLALCAALVVAGAYVLFTSK